MAEVLHDGKPQEAPPHDYQKACVPLRNDEWLHQPIAYAARQITGGRFHQEGKRTIQRRHIGWNRIGHLSHQLEEPLQVEPQDRPEIYKINAP